MPIDRKVLKQILTIYYSGDELHDLCFSLDIEHENLPASTLSRFAEEIIKYCERHGHYTILEETVKDGRPHAFEAEPEYIEQRYKRQVQIEFLMLIVFDNLILISWILLQGVLKLLLSYMNFDELEDAFCRLVFFAGSGYRVFRYFHADYLNWKK